MLKDKDAIAEATPKLYNILLPGGDGHGLSIEQICEHCSFCAVLLELPELLRQAVLDLALALAASL